MRTFATALCIAAAIGAASAASLRARALSTDSSWETYKSVVGLAVTDAEDAFRAGIFAMNVKFIKEHNERFNAGVETSFMAVNHFTHLSQDEFAARYIGGWRGPTKRTNPVDTDLLIPNDSVPASIDWSQKGAVTPIKNQEQCGSCWAFSTTGSVEGISYIKTGTLVSLSEQQLVDCSGKYGNQGCNGGLMDNAFKYIIANKGICSEAAYPYTATQGTCEASTCTAAATISGYFDVPKQSDTAMMAALAQQPVSIAIEADQMSFQFYSGGVMTAACGDKLDHGVLAVGYGTLSGKDFYKVKNSWGATWGMQGYILLGRGSSFGKSGQCGMLSVPSYPTKN